MPIIKNQHIRIKVIDECLTQRSYWTQSELIDKIKEVDIDICKRTFEQDIADMKRSTRLGYHAPINFCRRNKGYYYTDPTYSVFKLPLNKNDIKALELAATTLDQYRYIPLMREFTTIIDKIIRVVNRVKMDNHATLLDFIEFEKTPVALGLEFMNDIIDAIQSKFPLELSYQKFSNSAPEILLLHPYFLKEYRNRWYVIGYTSQRKAIRTYAFDRIKSVTQTNDTFMSNTFIETKEYLKKCIGINLRDGKVNKVRLEFTSAEGMYIKTQKLHHSQKIVQDNAEAFIIDLEVVINFELVGIILSYGPSVKVLKPTLLVKKIQEIANKVLAKYN